MNYLAKQPVCDCYKSKINNMCFVHDFKLNAPLDETYTNVYNKYKRRINRLYKMVQNSKKVCFVYVTAGFDKAVYKENKLVEAQKILSQKFPKIKIDILYFENGIGENPDNYVDINKNIRKYIFNFATEDKNTPWEVNDEKIARALKNFSISHKNLTFRNILQKYNIFSMTKYQNRTKILFLGIKIKFKTKRK